MTAIQEVLFPPDLEHLVEVERFARHGEMGLTAYVAGNLLAMEEAAYRSQAIVTINGVGEAPLSTLPDEFYRRLMTEWKLLFMTGGPGGNRDVREVIDSFGNPVYTKRAEYFKVAETDELRAEVSTYIDREGSIESVFSELADIWYNLFQLRALDPSRRADYNVWIDYLCQDMGISADQAAMITAAKYEYRMRLNGGRKHAPEENQLIRSLLIQQHIMPKDMSLEEASIYRHEMGINLTAAAKHVSIMENTMLLPRLLTLQGVTQAERVEADRRYQLGMGD